MQHFTRKAATALAFLALWLSGTAMAETYVLPNGKPLASITIPETWESSEIAKGVEATSPDEGVYIAAEIVDTNKIEDALAEAIKYLVENGVEIDQSSLQKREGKFGGFEAVQVAWSGKDENGPTNVLVAIVFLSETKTMFFTYWGSPEAGKANSSDLNAIVESVVPQK